MSEQTWTRAHDAILAARAEGWGIVWFNGVPVGEKAWSLTEPPPHYNTDIAAAMRALEAWRLQEPEKRSYVVMSPDFGGTKFKAICWIGSNTQAGLGESESLPEACAAALLQAVGGAE